MAVEKTKARNGTRAQVAPQIADGLDRMWDSGFCAGLCILSQQIREFEKTTAQTTRIQERIQQLLGSLDANPNDRSR